jgi:hypothetical protein
MGVCHWQGGFEQHYRIGAGRVENGEKEKLGRMESWTTCHCDGRNCEDLEVCENQKYHFQAIVIDCLACTEAKWCCSNRSVTLGFISSWRPRFPREWRRHPRGVDTSNLECVVPIM